MKKMIIATIIATIFLAGCGSVSDTSDYSMKATSNDFEAASEVASMDYYDDSYSTGSGEVYGDAVNDYGKKLVHNYCINIQTTEYDTVVNTVKSKVDAYNGYVESSDMNNYDNSKELSMTIRIPQEKAEEFLNFVGESGNITYSSESTTDKTLDYVDIDSRMNSYKQELETMENLAKRAENVTELIEIENNIANLRGQIDSYQSQLNTIDNKVSYATIDLRISEVDRYSYVKPGFWANIGEGLKDSFDQVGDMVSGYIIAIPVFLVGLILFMIPFSLVVVMIVFVIRLCKKVVLANKNKQQKAVNNSVPVKEENKDLM